MPIPATAAPIFADLKRKLRAATGMTGTSIARHNVDLLLAATALAESCVIVSNDGIFPRLAAIDARLRVENWSAPGAPPNSTP